MEKEGVVKFKQNFSKSEPLSFSSIKELESWRRVFFLLKIIGGGDPERYKGLGFGNVSKRHEGTSFVVSGTQTGHIPHLNENHYSMVLSCDHENNEVITKGPIEASSESMTHGVLYKSDPRINFVFHTHCPQIWNSSEMLGLLMTDKEAEYGTPEMAEEVIRLYRKTDLKERRLFGMAGHTDGIVSFGGTADEAGLIMLKFLVQALALQKKSV